MAHHNQTKFARSAHWHGASIAQGDAGLAFACAALDGAFPDEGWDRAGHMWLERAVSAPPTDPVAGAYGLMAGATGLSLAVWQLSRGGTRYRRLQADLDAVLVPGVHALADRVAAVRQGIANADYDVVSGVSGMVAGLLPRRCEAEVSRALDSCIDALVALAEPAEPPRWLTPPGLTADRGMLGIHPRGHLNLGMAHGVPGIIAALAMAHRCGMRRKGMEAALARLAAWVNSCRVDDEWGPNWPSAVSAPPAVPATRPCRGAWCYGAPGIASALWIASEILSDGELADLAIEAILAVHRRPANARNIDSPTVCHGIAGLLQVTRRLANSSGDPQLLRAADSVLEAVLDAEELDSIMGYRNLEPGGWPVDHPGLLDGSVGVLLALLDVTADTRWDRLLMLG